MIASHHLRRTGALMALAALALPWRAGAQQGFTAHFPPEEFAARRSAIIAHAGDAVVVMQGTTERAGEQPLRQSNQFFYVTGVVEPRALLLIDGRAKRTTLFLAPRSAGRERMIGPYLWAGDSAARVTGIDAVMPRDSFAVALAAAVAGGRAILTPFRPEVLGSASASDAVAHVRATKSDPWDGRASREEAFIAHLKERAPGSEIRNLDPLLDSLRAVKSPREIAVIREATRQAGLGIMEVMRDAKPGMYEYELEAAAEYVYKRGGAYGEAYFPLIADGRNMPYSHYHKNSARLTDGDLVQFDWAPDYANYTSDVTRVFPANGHFTPRQREFYTVYLRCYQAIVSSIAVHATQRAIIDAAAVKMDSIVAHFHFTDHTIEATARAFVAAYRRNTSLGHTVGMEVHDVRYLTPTLEPGTIFTIEPQMTTESGDLSVRLEDMVLITSAGVEVMSRFVPIEIADIEKLMTSPGLGAHALREPRP